MVIVTDGGMVVRCPVNQIRTSGRNAQGVKVIRLKEGHKVAAAARVVDQEDNENAAEPQLELLDDEKEKKDSGKKKKK